VNANAGVLLEQWLAGVAVRSRHTAANYRYAAGRFLDGLDKEVAEITPADAAAFLAKLNASQLAPGSKAAYISGVRSFLSYAQDIGILAKSPIAVLKRPRVEITSMNRYLTADEARTLLRAARRQEILPLALMLTTGLRVSEVAGAEWRHVFLDPEGRRGLLVHGKGSKSRVVALPDRLWELIRHARTRRGLSHDLDDRDTTPVVADRRGTPFTRQGLLALVRRVTFRAGLRKRVSPHWLRHSFGTLAALGDVPVFQIQQDMGHASISTSQRYVHWAKGLQGAGANTVAAVLFR
jgi:integrase/recombinase XerD